MRLGKPVSACSEKESRGYLKYCGTGEMPMADDASTDSDRTRRLRVVRPGAGPGGWMRATRQGQLRDHRPDRDDARSGFHAGAALLRIDPARDPKAASILSCIGRQTGVLSGPRGACPRPFSGTERTELIRHSGTAVTCARLAHRPSVFCTWTNPGVSACFEPVDQQFPR